MIFDFLDPISWEYSAPYYLAALAVGYLLGSIPFGLLLTKAAGLGDVRNIGSGNIGATNVLRTGNKALAAATLLLDGGKGAVAVLIGLNFGDPMGALAGTGAFFGHLFPVWLGFKGGKGVATFLGLTLALYWPVGALCCLTWLATAALFRISSLAALVAAASAPLYMWSFSEFLFASFSILFALMIFYAHRENIARLLQGQEPKIGAKKS